MQKGMPLFMAGGGQLRAGLSPHLNLPEIIVTRFGVAEVVLVAVPVIVLVSEVFVRLVGGLVIVTLIFEIGAWLVVFNEFM